MKIKICFLTLLFVPNFLFAKGLQELITDSYSIVDSLTLISVGIALLAFFWGLAQFILHKSGGSEIAYTEGTRLMIWGIISLVVIVSIWGIIGLLQSEFGLSPTNVPINRL